MRSIEWNAFTDVLSGTYHTVSIVSTGKYWNPSLHATEAAGASLENFNNMSLIDLVIKNPD